MNAIPPEVAQAAVADPSTPAEQLGQIASQYRELWDAISNHPNVYPELLEWMRQQGFEAAGAQEPAPQQTTAQLPRLQQPAAQLPATQQPAPRRRVLPWVLGGAGVAVLLAVALVLALVILPGIGGAKASIESVVKSVGMPDDEGYSFIYLDLAKVDSFSDREETEGIDWSAMREGITDRDLLSDEIIDRADVMGYLDAETPRSAYIGDYSASVLEEAGAENLGDDTFSFEADWGEQWLKLQGNTIYVAQREEEVPEGRIGEGESLADDQEFMETIDAVNTDGMFSMNVSSRTNAPGSAEASVQAVAIAIEGSEMVLHAAYSFENAEDAAETMEVIEDDTLATFGPGFSDDAEYETEQMGTIVVATLSGPIDDIAESIGLTEADD